MATIRFVDLGEEIQADERGMSFFPWQGRLQDPGDLLRTFHLISIRPGQTRGNHVHPGHVEWLYPFHGVGIFIWENGPGCVQEQVISGDHTLIQIPPGIPHALKNPGPEILYLLAWREAVVSDSTEPETRPHSLPG